MTTLSQTLEQYQTIKDQLDPSLDLAAFRRASWSFHHAIFSDAQAINAHLQRRQLTSGWLTLPSQVVLFKDYQFDQRPLAAQACNNQVSIDLRWYNNAYHLTEINPNGDELEGLVSQEQQSGHGKGVSQLWFDCLWVDKDGAMRKVASRLTGVKN